MRREKGRERRNTWIRSFDVIGYFDVVTTQQQRDELGWKIMCGTYSIL